MCLLLCVALEDNEEEEGGKEEEGGEEEEGEDELTWQLECCPPSKHHLGRRKDDLMCMCSQTG